MTGDRTIDGETIEELRTRCKEWSIVVAKDLVATDDLVAADRLKTNLERIDADRIGHGLPPINRERLWPFDVAIDLVQAYLGEQGLPRLTWEQIAELGEIHPNDRPAWLEKRRGTQP